MGVKVQEKDDALVDFKGVLVSILASIEISKELFVGELLVLNCIFHEDLNDLDPLIDEIILNKTLHHLV